MRVIVGGGLEFVDGDHLVWALDYWQARICFSHIVHTGQAGAAAMAQRWADLRHIQATTEEVTPEEWRRLGGSSMPILNGKMIRVHKPELVITFPGGPETADLLVQAKTCGIKCVEVSPR